LIWRLAAKAGVWRLRLILFSGSELNKAKIVDFGGWKLTPFLACVIIFSPTDLKVGGLFVVYTTTNLV
jgi:hypothetical protein